MCISKVPRKTKSEIKHRSLSKTNEDGNIQQASMQSICKWKYRPRERCEDATEAL